VNDTSGAPNRLIGIATPLLLPLAWELAGDFGIIDVRFFPPPSRIAHQIGVLFASGELVSNTLASTGALRSECCSAALQPFCSA
jgi:ABC-type nitrate/sulfonate/bicarbonate transport system permease component